MIEWENKRQDKIFLEQRPQPRLFGIFKSSVLEGKPSKENLVFIDPKRPVDQRSMRYSLSPILLPPSTTAFLTEVGIALPLLPPTYYSVIHAFSVVLTKKIELVAIMKSSKNSRKIRNLGNLNSVFLVD